MVGSEEGMQVQAEAEEIKGLLANPNNAANIRTLQEIQNNKPGTPLLFGLTTGGIAAGFNWDGWDYVITVADITVPLGEMETINARVSSLFHAVKYRNGEASFPTDRKRMDGLAQLEDEQIRKTEGENMLGVVKLYRKTGGFYLPPSLGPGEDNMPTLGNNNLHPIPLPAQQPA